MFVGKGAFMEASAGFKRRHLRPRQLPDHDRLVAIR